MSRHILFLLLLKLLFPILNGVQGDVEAFRRSLNPFSLHPDTLSQYQLREETLDDVVISSSRLSFKLKESSQTVQIIPLSLIEQSGVTQLTDLLQHVNGLDIQRRGTGFSQADLTIRGGTFDQSLLLIDGIRLDDAQTGHHTLNFLPPLSIVERIEITKGPSARIFGQNAFTGAVNIITRKEIDSPLSLQASVGSFAQRSGHMILSATPGKHSLYGVISRNQSDGYRYNTDFVHSDVFLKASVNTRQQPLNLIAYHSVRQFGANGFYATPAAIDQYEETEATLLALSRQHIFENLVLNPRVYWRRGEDLYQYIRNRPEIYENLHKTNKTGASLDAVLLSSIGDTGLGVDVSDVRIHSNNLGNRSRRMMTLFLEHRFTFFNERIDFTPGIAAAYFSDFKWHTFPGADIGIRISEQVKVYANLGKTYRIPTYTDLYYADRTTLGNPALLPERALAHEAGIRFNRNRFWWTFAYFSRESTNLIDYVKNQPEDLFQAENIQRIKTKGVETETFISLSPTREDHHLQLGYTYLQNSFQEIAFPISRYSLNNDLRHQFTSRYTRPIGAAFTATASYRWIERSSGRTYQVADLSARWKTRFVTVSTQLNNVFDETYWETSLIPMPGRNLLLQVTYTL